MTKSTKSVKTTFDNKAAQLATSRADWLLELTEQTPAEEEEEGKILNSGCDDSIEKLGVLGVTSLNDSGVAEQNSNEETHQEDRQTIEPSGRRRPEEVDCPFCGITKFTAVEEARGKRRDDYSSARRITASRRTGCQEQAQEEPAHFSPVSSSSEGKRGKDDVESGQSRHQPLVVRNGGKEARPSIALVGAFPISGLQDQEVVSDAENSRQDVETVVSFAGRGEQEMATAIALDEVEYEERVREKIRNEAVVASQITKVNQSADLMERALPDKPSIMTKIFFGLALMVLLIAAWVALAKKT